VSSIHSSQPSSDHHDNTKTYTAAIQRFKDTSKEALQLPPIIDLETPKASKNPNPSVSQKAKSRNKRKK
jgi:hypothetical protein